MFKRRPQYNNNRKPQYERKPFVAKVSLPQQSRYEGEYVTLSFGKDVKGKYESFFKLYLNVNQYGAYKPVSEQELYELYMALDSIFNNRTQQRQPQPQQRQPQPLPPVTEETEYDNENMPF